ncbi:MAG TPA: gamma-glutamyltransferase family protein [Gammaproteobacteria bacterium]|nr:gamma-glutamyltransferase family protein [Gammaproteobacteria bacterium]
MSNTRGQRFATRSVVMGRRGMVATSHPLATEIGVDTLRRGGSAVDAAIAANAALGLMEPTGCGIGGDLFAIVRDAGTGRLFGLNATGRSPRALTLDHFERLGLKHVPDGGPLSVSVPGAVDGWFELHARFGTLPVRELLAPAIGYGRDGFPVSEVIARDWAAGAGAVREYAGFDAVFLSDGRAPRAGETFRNPRLADAYELLSSGGRDAFYRGPIAEAVHDYLGARGGYLRRDDFAAHRSTWVEPVSTGYRGWEVFELPPNGQGIAVLQMLNLLEGYDLPSLEWGGAEHLHLLIEAKKLAFEDRARFYADPEFAAVPVDALISKEYAARRRAAIDPRQAARAPEHGDPTQLRGGDTVYLAAADGRGTMVSLIQSNYLGFGSGMTIERFGFGLQSRGSSFALEAGHPNVYEPGKRPFHTIIPGFAIRQEQGAEALLAFGVMGAAMQPQGQVQVLSNMIDFGMNPQEAGDAPRVRHEGSTEPTGGARMRDGGIVYVEPGIAAESLEGLRALGHRVDATAMDGGSAASAGAHSPLAVGGAFGGYQAILLDRGVYHGASESRKDGHAAGY